MEDIRRGLVYFYLFQQARFAAVSVTKKNAIECSICNGSADLHGKVGEPDAFYHCIQCGAYGDTWVGIFEDLSLPEDLHGLLEDIKKENKCYEDF